MKIEILPQGIYDLLEFVRLKYRRRAAPEVDVKCLVLRCPVFICGYFLFQRRNVLPDTFTVSGSR